MPLHHYLPASFLAQFSTDSKIESARDRFLVVGDKKTEKIFRAPANKVGCLRNLYTLYDNSADPNEIDRTWTEYERKLPVAIDSLINKRNDAETWIRVLVPFVSCMLIRVPDFVEKFGRRWPREHAEQLSELLSKDNANHSRLFELQRLLGLVATAQWLVLSAQGKETLITNDLGYSPFLHPPTGDIGMAIPLNGSTILAIIPTLNDHPILEAEVDKWVPIIHYGDLPIDNHQALNKALAETALRFVFSSDESVVQKYTYGIPIPSSSPEPGNMGFPNTRISRAFEFTWHRLVGVINRKPTDPKSWDFPIDWNTIASGWYSMPFMPTNLVGFPPPLKRIQDTIYAKFYDPEIYYTISHILNLQVAGQHDPRYYEEALKEITRVLSRKTQGPLKARILGIRGNILTDIGKFAEAANDFEHMIDLDRSNTDHYANYGYMLIKSGDFRKAYKILSKGLKINPEHGIAYSNRSVAQWKLGYLKEAVDDVTIAIGLLPEGIEKAAALFNRAKIFAELNLEEQASQDFAQSEALHKKYATNRK